MEYYQRVIPRDLFNEAKLLNCLGKLVIAWEESEIAAIPHVSIAHEGQFFVVIQRQADGGLQCTTVEFFVGDLSLDLYVPYNSKERFPLRLDVEDADTIEVLDDEGKPTREFIQFLRDVSSEYQKKEIEN